MSSFRGDPDEAWSLARAVDSMRDAARAAGRPSLVWLAGIFYPALRLGLNLNVQLGGETTQPPPRVEAVGSVQDLLAPIVGIGVASSGALILILVFYSRLTAGLARLSPPRVWEQLAGPRGAPSLRTVWQAGRGLTRSAVGLWLSLGLLQQLAAAFVFATGLRFGQVAGRAGGDLAAVLAWIAVAGPLVALFALYAVVLSVLHQLALQSLAHNRRGVASALVHAWRIARHDPRAIARCVAVDLVLTLAVLVLSLGLGATIGFTCFGAIRIAALFALALNGFAGVARAGFWARAYRALGGLAPEDGVPGLATP